MGIHELTGVRSLGILALALLASCHDTISTSDPVVSAPDSAWSGNTVALVSPSFRGVDTLPIITLGTDTIAASVGGRDSVLLTLPDTGGRLTYTVALHAGGQADASVQVLGFRSASQFAADVVALPWGSPATPAVLAPSAGQLVAHDLQAGNAVTLGPSPWPGCGGGAFGLPAYPSVSDPTLVVASLGCGPLAVFPVLTGGAPSDTGPALTPALAVHVRTGHWLIHYKSSGTLFTHRTGAASFAGGPAFGSGQAFGVAISPRKDRLVLAPYEIFAGGLLVLDLLRDTLAFSLPGWDHVGGADFSPDGDTLFVLAKAGGVHSQLLVLDAATGTELRRLDLGGFSLDHVSVDPAGHWLYIVAPFAVRVLDRATLTNVATLRVPQSVIPPGGFQYWVTTLPDPVHGRLYVVSSLSSNAANPRSFSYDIMR